jgi:hypothetical protein
LGAPSKIPLLDGLVDLSSRARIGNTAGSRLHVGRSTTLFHALRDELRHCTTASAAGMHRGLTPNLDPVK